MRISVTEAKSQLTELVRRAEAGDDVVLTRHGHEAVRLVAIRQVPNSDARRKLMEDIRQSAIGCIAPGETAARSQDFLYDENGLP